MSAEWAEIVQGSLDMDLHPRDRVVGFVAEFPCGVGYVYRLDGTGLWLGMYEPGGAERMTSEPCWRMSEAMMWCERVAGVAPVALGLGI